MRTRLLVGIAVAACAFSIGASAAAAALSIHVLSNRADAISGGDALVSVSVPRGVSPSSVKVTLGSSDITNEFAPRPNGAYEGLVTGLQVGSNALTAEAPGQTPAQATIVNHAIGGPAISGPQVQPWVCKNAHPTDAKCDEAPT
jgi:hypothetical protein